MHIEEEKARELFINYPLSGRVSSIHQVSLACYIRVFFIVILLNSFSCIMCGQILDTFDDNPVSHKASTVKLTE